MIYLILCYLPVIGWIQDMTNYTIMLHYLNITTYLTTISWIIQNYFKKRKKKKRNEIKEGIGECQQSLN
uniref:Uncharacterized protein n=1 Tax=Vespula pensylvanica TaxID=30213 RepID=A0A834P5E5_VESPE|nr:hypothetical protein H0235_005722 [Vespula pensylvanica]